MTDITIGSGHKPCVTWHRVARVEVENPPRYFEDKGKPYFSVRRITVYGEDGDVMGTIELYAHDDTTGEKTLPTIKQKDRS